MLFRVCHKARTFSEPQFHTGLYKTIAFFENQDA